METLPFQQLKREALTLRVNKLIEWLQRPEYATYKDHDSIIHLAKLINLIIWALERSIPPDQWEPFRVELTTIRTNILDRCENEEAEIATYYSCVAEIEAALKSYLDFIRSSELVKMF